ncbi:hypothetical protein PSI22_19315 [Xenorhabdus sp. XENO-7]|uniref:Uncharacterized protein n=1 Tax=Xenorhabdus aichiensis TaxID=3025874 RepID=A0ABT5M7P1_9GAMM|nr:hypothetical protein [Xenorhabdus aichiensis]MDC9623722.1 hypothetical protein [Xenorhabdus aichiensis]
MDTVVGTNAGKACATCDTPPSCTHKYEIKGEEGTHISFPKEHKIFEVVNIISEHREYTLTSELTPVKCISEKPDCPSTHIYSQDNKAHFELTPKNKKQTYTIKNNAVLPEIDIWDKIRNLFTSWDDSIEKTTYYSQTTDCSGLVQSSQINVYPKYSLSASIELGVGSNAKDYNQASRSDYTREEFEQLKKELKVEKWSEIGKYIHARKYKLDVGYKTQFFDEEIPYEFTLYEKNKNVWNHKNSITQKLRRSVENMGNHLLKKAGGSFGIKEVSLNGPNISIKGKKEFVIINSHPDFEYNWRLSLAPLLGVKITLDIINVILAIIGSPKAGSYWQEFREEMENQINKLEDHENKLAAGGICYFDLVITGNLLNASGNLIRKEQKTQLIGKFGSSLKLEIKGGVIAGARFFFVEGLFSAYGGAEAEISTDLICDASGLAICFAHEAVKLVGKVQFKAGYSRENDNNSISQSREKGANKKNTPINISLIDTELIISEGDKSEPIYLFEF